VVINSFETLINQKKQLILYELKYDTKFSDIQTHQLYVTNYIYDVVKGKKSSLNPFILIIKGPHGVGKSRILKNKTILNKFGIDMSNCIIANIDEIKYQIPSYLNAINKIKEVLKGYLNKKLSELVGLVLVPKIDPKENTIIQNITIHDIINEKNKNTLSLLNSNDMENIYIYLFESNNIMIDGKSLNNYITSVYYEASQYSEIINSYLISFCIKNNFNLVLETWKRTYDTMMSNYNFNNYKKYLVMFEINNTEEAKIFVTKNLIKRVFEEGRVLSYNMSVRLLGNNDVYNESFKFELGNFNDYHMVYVDKKLTIKKILNDIANKNIPLLSSQTFDKTKFIDFNQTNNRYDCNDEKTYTYNDKHNYGIGCFLKSNKIKTISKDIINSVFTDIIVKHILSNNEIRTILIYDWYVNYRKILDNYIDQYNLSGKGLLTKNKGLYICCFCYISEASLDPIVESIIFSIFL
jgi:hypothetical protein